MVVVPPFDVFLAYKRQPGERNEQVERLRDGLQRLGLNVWFDQERSSGGSLDGDLELCNEGIAQSTGALFLVNQRYYDDVASPRARRRARCNAQLETIMQKKRPSEIVVVVTDDQVGDSSAWKGRMLQLNALEIVTLSDLDQLVSTSDLDKAIASRLLPRMKWLNKLADPGAEGDGTAGVSRAGEPGAGKVANVKNFRPLSGSAAKEGRRYPKRERLQSSPSPPTTPQPPTRSAKTERMKGRAMLRKIVSPEKRAESSTSTQEANRDLVSEELEMDRLSLEQIQKRMVRHQFFRVTQIAGCHAISRLASNCQKLRMESSQLAIMHTVRGTMRIHEKSAAVQAAACKALASLTFNNYTNKLEAGQLGLLADIKNAMDAYPDSADVQEQASIAIQKITCNSRENRDSAVDLMLIQTLRKTLRGHLSSPGVQLAVCAAIQNIIYDHICRRDAKRLNIQADVARTLDMHLFNPGIELVARILLDQLNIEPAMPKSPERRAPPGRRASAKALFDADDI